MILSNEEKINEYTNKGWWTTKTIYDFFEKQVKNRPHVEAIVDPINREKICSGKPKRLTFGQLNEEVDRLAAFMLHHGIKKDDIIVIQLPNVTEIVIAYLAILRIGAIASPFPVQYREHEYEELINFVEAKAIITMTQISGRSNAQCFADKLDQLPTVEKVFAWGKEYSSNKIISLENITLTSQQNVQFTNYISLLAETANDIFTICWTSGTEGKPKGVPRSHNEWFISSYTSVDIAEITEKDILLNTFPMVNMAGIAGMFVPWLLTGSKLIMHHPFDLPVFLQQIMEEKATYTLAPPALLNMMLNRNEVLSQADISSLKAIGTGSAPLSAWMVKGWKENHNIDIINFFGSNEGISLMSGPMDFPDPEKRAKYFPRFGVKGLHWSTRIANRIETRLVDIYTQEEIIEPNHPGELRIKGAATLTGYWKRPDLNEKIFDSNGFFCTGDLFEIVGDDVIPKYYRYVGRTKDLIIRGGVNISPEEVESILQSHPKVFEVAVVGYPDPIMGEKACACIVLKPGVNEITLDEIKDYFIQHQIAKFKIPERLIILDSLPRNPVGKILKRHLRNSLTENNENHNFLS